MKRTALLGLLLVAVLACAAAFSAPEPAHALLCCDNGGYTTSNWFFWAPTCSEAMASYRAQVLPEAQDFCGGPTLVCQFTTPACYPWNGGYKVNGVSTFGCREPCGPIGP